MKIANNNTDNNNNNTIGPYIDVWNTLTDDVARNLKQVWLSSCRLILYFRRKTPNQP